MSPEKKTVILSLGPLHLFWTTGVYYLYELSQAYNVILIAWDNYESDPDFQQAISKFNVCEIIYIPVGGSLKRNWFLARTFRELSRRRKISLLFQHDHAYEDNLYLQCLLRREQSHCKFITYQNGMRMVNYYDEDYQARNAMGVNNIILRHGYPSWVAKRLLFWKMKILYLANYKVFPFLFAGVLFHPERNVYSGKRQIRNFSKQKKHVDYMLFYTSEELDAYKLRNGVSDYKCILIRHPLEDIGNACNRLVYGEESLEEEEFILLLPSYGSEVSPFLSV